MCGEYLDYQGIIGVIKAVVICRKTGPCLVDLLMDSKINSFLISGFVSALNMFGEQNVGKIKSIHIEGLEVDFLVVSRHDLILAMIVDEAFVKDDLRREAENILDAFILLYKNELEENTGDLNEYIDFKNVIISHLHLHVNIKDKVQQEH